MSKRRSQKHTPREYNIKKPHDETRDRPDRRDADQQRLFEKQTERHNEVADVAHPAQVSELIDPPVVNALCEKKEERQQADETHSGSGGEIHRVLSSRTPAKKPSVVLTTRGCEPETVSET